MNFNEDDEIAADRARDEREFLAEMDARRRAREAAETLECGPSGGPPEGTIAVEVDVRIASPLNGSHSGHVAVSARRRRERQAFAEAFAEIAPPTWPSIFVALERIASAKLDGDNLQAGFKSIRDACAAWLGLDDADPKIKWDYFQRLARVKDETPRAKHPWRSWCRVVLAPSAAELAAVVVDAELVPPAADRRILPSTRKPRPAPPEPVGGALLAERPLPPRGGSSRLVVSLRVLEKPSGRGQGLPAGAQYIRLAVHWEQAGDPWRSAGVVVRMDEVDALVSALVSLRDA